MKRIALLLLVVAGLFSLSPSDFNTGSKAPKTKLKMQDISGEEYALEDMKGEKGLIVIFSCNTCPFVVGNDNFGGWEQQYNDVHAFAKKTGYEMVLINSNAAKRSGDDSFKAMKEHAAKNKYTMKYLVDKDAELADAFGARTTPHVFLLDEKMKLRYQGPIDNAHDAKSDRIKYLRNAISYQEKNQKITTPIVAPVGCSIKRTK
jgi:peroxiredoxin